VPLTGEDIDARRALVPGLLDWACEGGALDEDHPNYQAVTEGRDYGSAQDKYSSCGDLAHWLFYRLGCRQEWLNRKEHEGWTVGANVSRLAFAAPSALRLKPYPGAAFDTGDVLIVWNNDDGTDAHVMVVYSFTQSPKRLIVAEFGQPGGRVSERKLDHIQGSLYIGRRRLQRWLPLALVLNDAPLADVSLPEDMIPPTDRAPPLEVA
jgi:hypothetical protein